MNIKIGGQTIDDDGEMYHIRINKPIYNTVVSINKAILMTAVKNKRLLKISTNHNGEEYSEIVSPWGWIGRSKRIEKVFKYPDNPMILFQGKVNMEADNV